MVSTSRWSLRDRHPEQTPAPSPASGVPVEAAVSRRLRDWYARWRPEILLALIVLLLTAPIVQPRMDQQESRFALTAAIWDDHTIVLDRYEPQLGVDRAVRDGHLYSDKAPGQPFLAIPAYALYRAFGGTPAIQAGELGNLGLWATSLLTSVLPAVVLVVLMRRLVLRVAPERATVAALAMATGTMLLPFATQLFAHLLTAALVFGAYLLLVSEGQSGGPGHGRAGARPSRGGPGDVVGWREGGWRLAVAGLLAATAVTVEYPAALLATVLFGVAVLRHRWDAGWFVAGGILPGVLLAAYQWVAFGGPLEFSYRYSQFAQHQTGVVGVQAPDPSLLAEVLFGDRGLFLLTPVVLLGLIGAGLVVLDREPAGRQGRRPDRGRKGQARFHGIVALVAMGVLLLIHAGWSNAWGGASPGPRYIVPALPFLVVGLARVWRRWPMLTVAASVFSIATMALATFTLPLIPRSEPTVLAVWLGRLVEGRTAMSILTIWWGDWALLLPPAVALAVAVRLLLRPSAADLDTPPRVPPHL